MKKTSSPQTSTDALQILPNSQAELLLSDTPLQLAELFRALSESTRIKILLLLLKEDLCVQHLAKAMEMNQSAISHQLRVLRAARLVKSRRSGKNTIYSLDDEHIRELISKGLEHTAHN